MNQRLAGIMAIAAVAMLSTTAAAHGRASVDECYDARQGRRDRHDHYETERIVGYDVVCQYNGRICHTRIDCDPAGPRVRVDVAVAE